MSISANACRKTRRSWNSLAASISMCSGAKRCWRLRSEPAFAASQARPDSGNGAVLARAARLAEWILRRPRVVGWRPDAAVRGAGLGADAQRGRRRWRGAVARSDGADLGTYEARRRTAVTS